MRGKKATFKMLWHRDRAFEVILDTGRKTLSMPLVLPQVPVRSEMYRKLKAFIDSRGDAALPEHRRIDRKKARVACANKAGNVSLTMTLRVADYEYATRKLIHLVNEIFLSFLLGYFEYQVEAFDLDPDRP